MIKLLHKAGLGHPRVHSGDVQMLSSYMEVVQLDVYRWLGCIICQSNMFLKGLIVVQPNPASELD